MIRIILDFCLALGLLILTLPIWLAIIIALLIFSPGPPFYRQERVGLDGRSFRLIKFRTMRQSQPGELCITVEGDRRITAIGRILRRFKLDELPQFLNILAGNMGFVGPRPEVPEYVRCYDENQKKILAFRPGLVDPAALKFRHEERLLARFPDPQEAYIKLIMPEKLRLSLEYQKSRNIFTDFMIILKTFGALLQKR